MWQVNQQRIGAADPVAVVAYSTLKQCTLEKSGGRLKKSRAGGDVVRCHLERGEEKSCYVVVRTQLPRSSSPMYLLPWLETTPASRQQYAPGGLQKEKGKGKKWKVRKKEEEKERRKQEKTSRRKHVIIEIWCSPVLYVRAAISLRWRKGSVGSKNCQGCLRQVSWREREKEVKIE